VSGRGSGCLVTRYLAVLDVGEISIRERTRNIWHTALSTSLFRKLKGVGTTSPSCLAILEKSIVFPSSRAGVPVCSRPSLKPAAFRDAESPTEGASPRRPAGKRFMPSRKEVNDASNARCKMQQTNMDFSAEKRSSANNDLGTTDNLSRFC
jgi:hypothetical protein